MHSSQINLKHRKIRDLLTTQLSKPRGNFRLITLNWANVDNRVWVFPDMTLLTGETGSGKSTLLDAIQTVLTATYTGVFFYNPGQEETTQTSRKKEKRTLPDYCLGREGTQLARESAHTYLACVFEPSEGEDEGQTLTAVVAVEAIAIANRADQSRLGLYIARNRSLQMADFMRENLELDGQVHVVEVREFWAHLQRRFGRDTVSYFSEDKGWVALPILIEPKWAQSHWACWPAKVRKRKYASATGRGRKRATMARK
jgi:energy-coupling factor transporter ATP-binding protein EcfA2